MKSPIHPEIEMKQVVRNGITIDYCPKSGGVWLDKGELEKLIELEKNAIENYREEDNIPFATNEKSRRSSDSNRPYEKKKKFENPLEDLFDFF